MIVKIHYDQYGTVDLKYYYKISDLQTLFRIDIIKLYKERKINDLFRLNKKKDPIHYLEWRRYTFEEIQKIFCITGRRMNKKTLDLIRCKAELKITCAAYKCDIREQIRNGRSYYITDYSDYSQYDFYLNKLVKSCKQRPR